MHELASLGPAEVLPQAWLTEEHSHLPLYSRVSSSSEVAALRRVLCLCVHALVDVLSDRVGTSLRGKWVPRVRDPLDNALAIAAALCSDDPATSQIMATNLGDVLSMPPRYCCRAILGGARMMPRVLLVVCLRLLLYCCFCVCHCALCHVQACQVPCASVPCACDSRVVYAYFLCLSASCLLPFWRFTVRLRIP